jgi:hypothetical protein
MKKKLVIPNLSLPAQHKWNFLCKLSTYRWVPPIRFDVNSRPTRDQCELKKNYPKSRGFSKFCLQCRGFMLPPHLSVNIVNGSEPPATTSFLPVGPACRNRC